MSKEANNRDQLLKVWEDNNYCKFHVCQVGLMMLKEFNLSSPRLISDLLDAYKSWLPDSAHESLTLIWPPIWYVNTDFMCGVSRLNF